MKKSAVLLLILISFLFGSSCDEKLFNLKAISHQGGGVSIEDILKNLAVSCDISIIFKDEQSKQAIKKRLDFINIKDYTLNELFDFLLAENNLFYSYDPKRDLLKIAKYKTKTFNIDYINLSSMQSESKKSIVLGTTSDISSGTSGTGRLGTGGSGRIGSGNNDNSAQTNDYTTITTKSEFTFWQSLRKQLETLLSGVDSDTRYKIFINKDASLVTVTGTKKQLEKVQEFLDRLAKRMHKQVLIEAKLIEVVYDDDQTVGIDWSKFNFSIAGSREGYKLRQDGVTINNMGTPNYFIGYNFSMDGLFDFLKKYGSVKILSNPKVLTLNNQPAIINVGDQLSYRYETSGTTNIQGGSTVGTTTYAIGQSFIGITLYVIPEITDSGEIIMKINPVTSELIGDKDLNNSNSIRVLPPDVKIKQLTSIVKVKDSQKILIGGLISKNYSNSDSKVPLLGNLPIVGRLFHSTRRKVRRSELFILIIPKIIEEHNIPTIDEISIFKEP